MLYAHAHQWFVFVEYAPDFFMLSSPVSTPPSPDNPPPHRFLQQIPYRASSGEKPKSWFSDNFIFKSFSTVDENFFFEFLKIDFVVENFSLCFFFFNSGKTNKADSAGGKVVSILTFYSDVTSSNLAGNLFLSICTVLPKVKKLIEKGRKIMWP